VVLLIPPSLTKGMREENQTSAKPTGPTEHAERTMHVTRLDGQRRSLNKKDKTQRNALLEGPNKEFFPCKYISKKLEQPKGWEIKGNKASRMPQQTASQFLSSATTKGVGERSPKSRLGTRQWAGTLGDPMPAVLPSSAAKRRALDYEASSSKQKEGASSGDAGDRNELRGDPRHQGIRAGSSDPERINLDYDAGGRNKLRGVHVTAAEAGHSAP
jgi:hypothetical protein